MADANLTAARLRELLDYDPETGEFKWKVLWYGKAIGSVAGTTSKRLGYRLVGVDGTQYYAHRLAWFYVHEEWPKFIDHINGDKLDNRLSNLRNVEQRINNQNRRAPNPNNVAGLLGVSYVPSNASQWVARVSVGRKSIYVKACKTPEEAHLAYLEAKRKIHEGCTL